MTESDQIMEQTDSSLLDIIDNVLNQGVVITGDLMLGVAGVDLVYLGLSVVLCTADRVLPTPKSSSKAK